MKSSTVRRSTLSKESMEVIENLAKETQNEDSIGEYVRPGESSDPDTKEVSSNKAQEIDLLWQNFKAAQFNTNSPTAYIILGFIIGVVVSVICFVCLGLFVSKSNGEFFDFHRLKSSKPVEQTLEQQTDMASEELEAKVVVPSEDTTNAGIQNEEAVSEQPQSTSSEQNFDKSKMKKYVVKNGDTVESIIKQHYGSYSQEKAELIMKANNLKTLDRINIDQELYIPVE